MNLGEECNCGNCSYATDGDWCPRIIEWDKTKEYRRKKDPYGMSLSEYTIIVGCMYHPRAREVLMADIVEGIRKHIVDHVCYGDCPYGLMNEDICKKYGPDSENGGDCGLCIFDHAVESLIRDGVK